MPDTASEIARLRAALAASEARAEAAESELAQTRAVVSTSEAMIKHLKLEISKLRREHYGHSSERRARLIDQMELQLEELEAAATEDEIGAQNVAKISAVAGFERRRPTRKPFPDHLPRERRVIKAPTTCSCCGSDRIVKMGEDITETLEVIPRQWKVIQTVREKFTCRICEKISQSPAPFYPTPRGWAGPNLLAMVLFEKFGQHQPLNRQAERYAKEGVDLSLSTLADQVGACAAALEPLHALIRTHVLAAERLHGDDTTVPSWRREGRRQRGSGPMSEMTGPLVARRRQPRCSTSRVTGKWPIRTGISPGGRASCKPMPTAAKTTSIAVAVIRARCSAPSVGATPGGSSSSLPTSRKRRARTSPHTTYPPSRSRP